MLLETKRKEVHVFDSLALREGLPSDLSLRLVGQTNSHSEVRRILVATGSRPADGRGAKCG
jgi:hypothetical protein